MSQRQTGQLTLVFVNSKDRSKRSKLDSVTFAPLRANSLGLSLTAKIGRLAVVNPDAAALIEQLVDDALADGPLMFPLE